MYSDILANLLLGDDLLVEHGSCAPLEPVVPFLLAPLVGCPEVAHECSLLLRDDRHVNIASRTQIVPDTSLNSICTQFHCLFPCQLGLPLCLEDGHGRQTSGAHRDVRQLVCGAVCVDCEEVSAGRVNAGNDEVCADVSLVAEQMLLEHGHAGHDAGFAAGREGMEFEVR